MMPWGDCEKPPAHGSLTPGEGFGGTFLAAAETDSGILPVSSMRGTDCQLDVSLSWVEWKDASGQADELQDQVSPPVCSWLTSLLSIKCYLGFLPTGSACVWCWSLFVSTECPLGISAGWFWRAFDGEGHLRGRGAIWAFCPLVLTYVYPWFVTMRYYPGVFVSWFWHVYLEDPLCWGSVY